MELTIKIEGHKERLDYSAIAEASCQITVDQKNGTVIWGELLQYITSHLLQIVIDKVNIIETEAE